MNDVPSPPTARQLELICLIYNYVLANGQYPTIREMARLLGVGSSTAIHSHLTALAKRGLVENFLTPREEKRSSARSIRLVGMRLVPCFEGPAGEVLQKIIEGSA